MTLLSNSMKNDISTNMIKLTGIPLSIFTGKFEKQNLFKTQFKNLLDGNRFLVLPLTFYFYD